MDPLVLWDLCLNDLMEDYGQDFNEQICRKRAMQNIKEILKIHGSICTSLSSSDPGPNSQHDVNAAKTAQEAVERIRSLNDICSFQLIISSPIDTLASNKGTSILSCASSLQQYWRNHLPWVH